MITAETLRDLLEYDHLTGKLYYKERPITMFGSQRAMDNWNRKYVGKEAFTAKHSRGYLKGQILGEVWAAHRIIWLLVTGEWPWVIDHINGNPGDNRIENLRNGNYQRNAKNRPLSSKNRSGISGVSYNPVRQKWVVTIGNNFLGSFDCFFKAVKARKAAEITHGYHANHGRSA